MSDVQKTPITFEFEVDGLLYTIESIGLERYKGLVVKDSMVFEADLTLRPYSKLENIVEGYR